jgi:hypothetical protein
MQDKGTQLRQLKRKYGLTAKNIRDAIPASVECSIDTIRKLGQGPISEEMLNIIERGIEGARLAKMKVLEAG